MFQPLHTSQPAHNYHTESTLFIRAARPTAPVVCVERFRTDPEAAEHPLWTATRCRAVPGDLEGRDASRGERGGREEGGRKGGSNGAMGGKHGHGRKSGRRCGDEVDFVKNQCRVFICFIV